MPSLGAFLYDWLAGRPRTMRIQFQEIARELLTRVNRGRLLDVGTGHGRLLREISTVNPDIELHGLDISPAMLRRAAKNLAGLKVHLRVANICSTGYETDFFDLVTCTGSFYLWSHPLAGLQEIYRILVPGGSAHLFEPNAETPEGDLRKIRVVLQRETLFRRLIGPHFIMRAVRMGLRPRELTSVLDGTPFTKNHSIERITLGGLPVWLHITLNKVGGLSA
jgi:ubiquinone/menaquinone biosynthesis C-methylase UbiE